MRLPSILFVRSALSSFAIEHTGIEPFPRQFELSAKDQSHFGAIRGRLTGVLPKTGHFVLHIPARATLDLDRKQLKEVQDALVDWVASRAPDLQSDRHARRHTNLEHAAVDLVPFPCASTNDR